MKANKKLEKRVDQLVSWYGDGADGGAPTRMQWHHIVGRPDDQPVTLINFFKLRDLAVYHERIAGLDDAGTGQDAFNRYAAVSMPTLEKVGGRFLLVAPFEDVLIGADENCDLVAIGSYPNNEALLALFEDVDYRAAYSHRVAACEQQKVIVVGS